MSQRKKHKPLKSKKIRAGDGALAHKYGLPPDTLGRHYQKDAVHFYHRFIDPRWRWPLKQSPFTMSLDEVEAFIIEEDARFPPQDRALTPLPENPSKADIKNRKAEVGVWRREVSKASRSGGVKNVIEWPFTIEVGKQGRSVVVMTLEDRVANGEDADKIESYVNTKQKNLDGIYRGINEKNHSEEELNQILKKSDADDAMLDGVREVINNSRSNLLGNDEKKLLTNGSESLIARARKIYIDCLMQDRGANLIDELLHIESGFREIKAARDK